VKYPTHNKKTIKHVKAAESSAPMIPKVYFQALE